MSCATEWQDLWDIGDEVRFSVETRNAKTSPAILADPTTLTVRVLLPDGTEITSSWPSSPLVVVRDGLGRFHVDVVLTLPKRWRVRWKATGALVGAEEGVIQVRESAFSSP